MSGFEIHDGDVPRESDLSPGWWRAWTNCLAQLYKAWDDVTNLTKQLEISTVQTSNFQKANSSLRLELSVQGGRLHKLVGEHDVLRQTYKRAADALREADEALIDTLEEATDLGEAAGLKQDRIESLQKSLAYWKDLFATCKVQLQAARNVADDYSTRLDNLNRNYNSMAARNTRENAGAYAEIEKLKDHGVHAQIFKERAIALNENATLRRDNTSLTLMVSQRGETIKRLREQLEDEDSHLSTREINDLNEDIAAHESTIKELSRENKKLRDDAVEQWLKHVSGLLSDQVGFKVALTPGPHAHKYAATAEQYVIQSRAAADKLAVVEAAMRNLEEKTTAKVIGADLGHWQGFKFADGYYQEDEKPGAYNYIEVKDYSVSLKPGTINWAPPKYIEAPGAYEWGEDVPKDTQFAIGGKTEILPGGGMGYYGTETTTVKIMDDTLSRALGSLTADLDEKRGQSVGSRGQCGQSVGSGQGPAISAAVTILPGGRIRLKLTVGSASHEVRTFLTAGGKE